MGRNRTAGDAKKACAKVEEIARALTPPLMTPEQQDDQIAQFIASRRAR